MSDVKNLRAALNREENKLVRQKEAVGATESLIAVIREQIAAAEKAK